MRILVAEDDTVTRRILESTLGKLGWDVITASDGDAAWRVLGKLEGKNAPELAVVDWMMPGMDGLEICRRLRSTPGLEQMYVILLTSRGEKEDLAAALAAGANDYIAKPFHPIELEARVRVGERMINLQRSIAARVIELEDALKHVTRLQGLLPICSYCKMVRNETNYWQQVEGYITANSELKLTHSVCPSCLERVMKELDENQGAVVDGVLDEGALLATVCGNRELAGELAQIFLEELEPRMVEMASAIRDGDATRLQFVAHALRGSAASMSATQVTASATVIETMGRDRDLSKVSGAFAGLEGELVPLRERLTILKQVN
jgi:CheY-like chemotaxis protein/HPt (histidine-containing phosphotransfer) domain-containing protein